MSKEIRDFTIQRFHVDLGTREVRQETVPCEDLEDVLGGAGRAFKVLAGRGVDDAYAPEATLVLNLGILSGTDFMTGLRTYFHAYSPLKSSKAGKPGAMWTAGSGKFGTKLRYLGVDEVVFTGRADAPTLLHVTEGPEFHFLDAADLAGKTVNGKVQALHGRFPDAHFAVIGPAGEHYERVRYAAIGLSTENQLRSGDPKARYCGRGGMGGVMGSKNLLAIAADIEDGKRDKAPEIVTAINKEVARGPGSQRFRDKDKGDGGGGTWANYEALNPVHAVPEMNFHPTGTKISFQLHRPAVEEAGPWLIKDEACYRCGIRCHKNIYEKDEAGKAGSFRAKFDYEPLNLLASNIGIFDVDQACTLVELVDELGMDSISLGVTLAYAMEYNRRHEGEEIAAGLMFGDFEKACEVIDWIGNGKMEQLGQGTKRLSEQLGETGYAMHCKGMEFPAYLPQTNPGYPWALAGGHMSMNTYLLLLYQRETGLDYWVEAIVNGPVMIRDDLLGVCKFASLSNKKMVAALEAIAGLAIDPDDLKRTVMRTHLRGYRLEKDQGFTADDYDMPAEAHEECKQIDLPYFNTPEFFAELKPKVLERFDAMLAEEGL